ncbi:MAG: DUF4852 domain-containing protein [Rhodospirillales bacterium]|nr:DUF4852 domain-containing protein [Rhodospirillales bacterium]
MSFSKVFIVLGMLVLTAAISMTGHAQIEQNESDTVIYEKPTIRNLSQLYWRLLKFKPDDSGKIPDIYIDNFLFINECDLYQEFSTNEFEWLSMRESTRAFLKENKDSFPERFEYMQPLRLANYDLESKTFEIWNPYKISGVRRFEVLAEDFFENVCHQLARFSIQGYPKGLLVEINRPFTLEYIEVPPEIAEIYIENKKTSHNVSTRKKSEIFDSRDAYLVMKIKFFSYKGEVAREGTADNLANVIGIMEGYEIYGDRKKELLLFSQNFNRRKDRSKIDVELKKRYQERLKKQMKEKKKALQESQGDNPEKAPEDTSTE